jgi:hypothetical protein
MSDCDALPNEYPRMSVAELPELAPRLEQISIDAHQWVRILRCRNCGQLWEEWYQATGHGELANTRKFSLTAPYDVLADVSRESRLLRSTHRRRSSSADTERLREFLWQQVPRLAETLRSTLRALAPGPYLEHATVYVDDPAYRQGAATVVLDFRFDQHDPFTVGVSCGIDHSFIVVRVSRAPTDAQFESARAHIEQVEGVGREVQLRDIRI